MPSGQAPLTETIQARVGALGATADGTDSVAQAPFAGTVTAATYVPDGAVTGAASPASRTLAIVNETQSLTVASLPLVGGTNLTAEGATALPLSGTPANLVVAAGDVLAFTSTHVGGTGLADPGGLVEVTISRT